MSDHSAEAIAAYPRHYSIAEWVTGGERTAFDRGASSQAAQQWAATSKVLFEFLADKLGEHPDAFNVEIADSGEYDTALPKMAVEDIATYLERALLASGGPLVDAKDVWDAGRVAGGKHALAITAEKFLGETTPELVNPYV